MPKHQKQKRIIRIGLWASFLLVLRLGDLYSTWLYTPGLLYESNPVVERFSLGWGGFLLIQLLLYLFIVAVASFYFLSKPLSVGEKGLSLPDFIYLYFFKELRPWPLRFFPKKPRHKNHARFTSFMILVASIGVSLFAITNNLLLLFEVMWYTDLMVSVGAWLVPLIFLLIVIFSSILFFLYQYSKYRKTN